MAIVIECKIELQFFCIPRCKGSCVFFKDAALLEEFGYYNLKGGLAFLSLLSDSSIGKK